MRGQTLKTNTNMKTDFQKLFGKQESKVRSFAETFGQACSFIEFYEQCESSNEVAEAIREYRNTNGLIALINALAEVCAKFELIHKNNEWVDEDYYETLDKFLDEEIIKL